MRSARGVWLSSFFSENVRRLQRFPLLLLVESLLVCLSNHFKSQIEASILCGVPKTVWPWKLLQLWAKIVLSDGQTAKIQGKA